MVGTSCRRVFQSTTRRSTWTPWFCFWNRSTTSVQYGFVRSLYWAITTLIVPEFAPAPPPPHPATSVAAVVAATARAHRRKSFTGLDLLFLK